MMFDAIVIGGSYAGLSAALQLARARRKVLVIDGGQRRNRFAAASHGFLGQDGRAPGDIVADARAQLMAYPTVDWIDGMAKTAEATGPVFAVETEDGESLEARRIVLAIGVSDELPEIPGLAERWGKKVFHCPYCHGYELGNGPIGVLGVSAASMHHAMMLPDWGRTTFFVNDAFDLDEDRLDDLKRRNVTVERGKVVGISGGADVELAGGRIVPVAGLFTATRTRPAGTLVEQLGCALEDGPMGPFIRTDAVKETTVTGVFAVGDAARGAGNVALAVGDGAMGGAGTHQSLIFRGA
ncbi:NAD(P)/FAD-dependent oxidoreductase [Mesorhizobium sp. ASY16-5R]|uniref:NAD(P)/FAD-dependent oxidoreductase n=1 Tax=Mesorhizobium sp. ASY16-5R TaxID=3445772 RepID=UPI003F9FE7F7